MRVHRTRHGVVVERDNGDRFSLAALHWDALFQSDAAHATILTALESAAPFSDDLEPLAPVASQEIWAAGVTWSRSRTARMEESEASGGSDFYDKVYDAERPELFLKATPHRVVGPGQPMLLRSDSKWIVPEPELTLAVSSEGRIFGYTIGNDLSCRDIEGDNPLYLPQAKVFDACAAVGPGLVIRDEPLPQDTTIHMTIRRDGADAFVGDAPISRMKRTPEDLVQWLCRHNSFPAGCLLMTGTGIVPPDDFCLQPLDEVIIAIDGLGELVNVMAAAPSG